MSEYRSPHNDGHDPYILIWEYGNDIRRAEFTERWAEYDETGWTVWYLTTIWMRPSLYDIERKAS